jgi:hypothetical protein
VEGNDRFIQDYGFLDEGGSKERNNSKFNVADAYKIVAKTLVGRRSGGSGMTKLTVADQERALEALKATTLEEDEELLSSEKVEKSDELLALEYRIGMKKALNELMG